MIGILRRVVVRATDTLVAAIAGNVSLARWKGVAVGEGCRIYVRHFGTEPFLISLGDRVTVTQGCVFVTHDGSTCLVKDQAGHRFQHFAPIVVGNDVFIGLNSILMPGVRIGSRVVIGAASVVTRDIPDNAVAAGNPARVICTFDEFAQRVRAKCPSDPELQDAGNYRSRISRAIAIEDARQGADQPEER